MGAKTTNTHTKKNSFPEIETISYTAKMLAPLQYPLNKQNRFKSRIATTVIESINNSCYYNQLAHYLGGNGQAKIPRKRIPGTRIVDPSVTGNQGGD